MTLFPQVRRIRPVAVFIGCICFPLGTTMAFAQGTTCAGAPAVPASVAASVTGQGNSSIPSEITVSWQGVPTTGPTAATTYIVEAGNASDAANIAVFDTRSTRTPRPRNPQPTEDITFACARRTHVGAARRRQKPS